MTTNFCILICLCCIAQIRALNTLSRSITIKNAGFETDGPLSSNSYTSGKWLSDWTVYMNAAKEWSDYSIGIANPTSSSLFTDDKPPEGSVIAYLSQSDESQIGNGQIGAGQTLSDNVEAGTIYSLKVRVGNPKTKNTFDGYWYWSWFWNRWRYSGTDRYFEANGFPGYRVGLFADDDLIGGDDNSQSIAEGEWIESNVVVGPFTSDNKYVGKPLEIRIENLNKGSGNDVYFDDVRLTATIMTDNPTQVPSMHPTTNIPTSHPTVHPTKFPTHIPSIQPSTKPTPTPTDIPSNLPTNAPTSPPSNQPSTDPTLAPTKIPTHIPSMHPTESPSNIPSKQPTKSPSIEPSTKPTFAPSNMPSLVPSSIPTMTPTTYPSIQQTKSQTPQIKKLSLPPSEAPTANPISSSLPAPIQILIPTSNPTRAASAIASSDASPTTIYPTTSLKKFTQNEKNEHATSDDLTVIIIIASALILAFSLISAICFYAMYRKKLKQMKENEANIQHTLEMQSSNPSETDMIPATHQTKDIQIHIDNETDHSDEEAHGSSDETQKLKQWLKEIGCCEYFEAFVKNGFGRQMSALYELNDDDLQQIGVILMGHRRLILREIKLLSDSTAGDMSSNIAVPMTPKTPSSDYDVKTPGAGSGKHGAFEMSMTYASMEAEGMFEVQKRESQMCEGNVTGGKQTAGGSTLGDIDEE